MNRSTYMALGLFVMMAFPALSARAAIPQDPPDIRVIRVGGGGAVQEVPERAATPVMEEGNRRLAQLMASQGWASGAEAPAAAAEYQVGDTRSFWAVDFTRTRGFPYSQYQVEAECRAVGSYAYYFVQLGARNPLTGALLEVSDTVVERFVAAFEDSTPGSPRDPEKGIYEHNTEVFGPIPDEDGDAKMVILFMNILDGATSRDEEHYGGYFYAVNQSQTDPVDFGGGVRQRSNMTEMLYVDIYPDPPDEPIVLSAIAHEMQHLIQWGNDPNEITAVNEGLSEYASFLSGFGLRGIAQYVTRPNVDLLSWQRYGSVLNDYSRMGLWTYYLGTRFGEGFIRALSLSPVSGRSGIEAALVSGGDGTDFAGLYQDFVGWLYVDDGAAGPEYSASPLRPWIEPLEHQNLYPARQAVTLEPLGATVLRYWNAEGITIGFPEGLPSGVQAGLAMKGDGNSQVTALTAAGATEPGLGSSWREGAVILTNTSETATPRFLVDAASAAQGDTGMVRYENGRPTLFVGWDETWWVGTRFKPEVYPARLTGVWLHYLGDEAARIQVRQMIPDPEVPGTYVIMESPLVFDGLVEPHFQNEGWVYLPVPGSALYDAPTEFLVATEAGTKSIAYSDITRKERRSFLRRGGVGEASWEYLTDISIGGAYVLEGDWMFRAEFEHEDSTAPTVELGLLQHPLFPQQADVIVLGDEPLHPGRSSGSMTLAGGAPSELLFQRTLGLNSIVDPQATLSGSGQLTLAVEAFDRYGGLSDEAELTVSVATLVSGQSATLTLLSDSGPMVVDVAPGRHPGTTLLLTDHPDAPAGLPGAPLEAAGAFGTPLAHLGPDGWAGGEVRLRLPLGQAAKEVPLHYQRWDGTRWLPVPGGVRIRAGSTEGPVPGGGWYRLARGEAPAAVAGSAIPELLGNAPNPFNPETVIRFRIPPELGSEPVRMVVLNTRGQQVRTLVDGVLGPGEHQVTWRGRDEGGRQVASGIYLYRLEVAGRVFTRKMVLLR